MPKWVEKRLKNNPREKLSKALFAIYLDLECFLKKQQYRENNNNNNNNINNIEESYTEKKAKHEPSGWAMFTRCSFDKKENKLNYYRGIIKDHCHYTGKFRGAAHSKCNLSYKFQKTFQ